MAFRKTALPLQPSHFLSEQLSAWPIRCLIIKNPIWRKMLWIMQGGCTVFSSLPEQNAHADTSPSALWQRYAAFGSSAYQAQTKLCFPPSRSAVIIRAWQIDHQLWLVLWQCSYEQFEFVGNKLKLRLKQIWTLKTKLDLLLHLQ